MNKNLKLTRLINNVIPILLFIFIFESCSNSELLLLKSDIDNLKNEVNIERNKTTDNNNKLDSLVKIIKNLTLNSQLQKNDLDEQSKIISKIEKEISILNLSDNNKSQEITILQNKIDSLIKVINNLNSQFNHQQNLTNNNFNQNNTTQNINSNINQNLFINNNISNLSNGNLYAWGSNLSVNGYNGNYVSIFGSNYASPTIINDYDWLYVKEIDNMILGLSNDSLLYLLNYDKETDSLILDINKNKFELVKQIKKNEIQDLNKRFTPVQLSKVKFKFIETMSNGRNTLYCLDKESLLWVYGNNNEGQFGTGNAINSNSFLIKTNFKCDTLIANFNTVIAIKEDGSLWGWGNNDGNKLFVENYTNESQSVTQWVDLRTQVLSPKFLNNTKWIELQIAQDYILSIKDDNTLWWWSYRENFMEIGSSTYGNYNKKHLGKPRELLHGKWIKVKHIKQDHINNSNLIALLSTDNTFYLYGFEHLAYERSFLSNFLNYVKLDTTDNLGNKHISKNFDERFYFINQPIKINNLKFKDIILSRFGNYSTNLNFDRQMISLILLTVDDELYGVGYNEHYNFGLGNNYYINELTKLNDYRWEKVYSFSKTLFLGKRQ